MAHVPASEGGTRVLEEFLRGAQQRGEGSVALARLIACVVFLVMHLPVRTELLAAADPKSWLLIVSLSLGLGFSVLSLRWARQGAVSSLRLHLSVVADALIVHITLGAAVLWPHPQFAGILREHETVIVYLAIIGAGIRLSEHGALFGAGLHGVGLAGLLLLDRKNAALLTYSPEEVVFAGAFFVVASMVSHSIAHRTRSLVMQGANAAVMAERARQRLGVYVSEEVASTAMRSEAPLVLGGSNMRAAVLFSDLRGFTRYAEGLSPEALVEELNAYLHEMVAQIREEGGVVDKYIGDAIMAVFGVPSARPDDAARAIRAAAGMDAALRRHNLDRASRGLPPLAHGIGVHHGPMVAGNIGTAERMQYTVIGDAVNLASRLESATKEAGVDVLISAAAVREAQGRELALPALLARGEISLRGHGTPISVHTFVAGPEAPS